MGAGGVKAPAAMTYNMTADTLPHLSHVQRWPYEEAAHSQAADQGTELLVRPAACCALRWRCRSGSRADSGGKLQAYWADYSTDRPQALGQLDLPHHDGALSMPVTPNTERIMMNDAATAQQPAEAAACSPTAGVPFPLHSMPGFGGHFEPHSEAMLLPDGFAMPSSMEIAHFHHQVSLHHLGMSLAAPASHFCLLLNTGGPACGITPRQACALDPGSAHHPQLACRSYQIWTTFQTSPSCPTSPGRAACRACLTCSWQSPMPRQPRTATRPCTLCPWSVGTLSLQLPGAFQRLPAPRTLSQRRTSLLASAGEV